jgi:energy-coupling factor transporter ATP-binding protein EcfA2
MSDPFEPIGGGKPAKQPAREFDAIMPVPADAPARPLEHPRLGKPTKTWTYHDAAGAVLGYMHRFDPPEGKQFRPQVLFRPKAGGRPQWRWESWPTPRPLYGLDRLAAKPDAPVVLTEGEKSADAAARLLPGHVAVTSANGSKSASKADWKALKGRHVTIWPDADTAGLEYAQAAEKLLRRAGAASIAIISPPKDVPEGWDAADAEGAGMDEAAVLAVLNNLAPASGDGPAAGDASRGEERQGRGARRAPHRDTLMALTTFIDLWHSPDGDGFATFTVGDHREARPIRSDNFKRWLYGRSFEETGIVPGNQAVEDTLRVLEARAINEGHEQEPWRRVGSRNGKLYLDLCDRAWRAIEIDGKGWRLLEKHNLPFVRSKGMRPLPVPEDGYAIDELRGFLNVSEDEDFVLVVAWLIASLRDRGPYPILVVNGEQGSGKSTFSRLLRTLVDPNAAPIRTASRDERDLIVMAMNSHVLAFDNMSKVDIWLSDALCRLATGGGFSTRALHTDSGEMLFMGQRPIILNGIPALTDRPDLADRAVNVRLRSISESERSAEDEFWANWDAAYPRVFGALLTGLSAALRNIGSTRLTGSPRLADFAKWLTAAEPGLGWEPGAFMQAYSDNRRSVADSAFEADAVAIAIRDLMATRVAPWEGTPTELLAALEGHASEHARKMRTWPATAQGLGNRLDRVAPLLRGQGLAFERLKSGNRIIRIFRLPN